MSRLLKKSEADKFRKLLHDYCPAQYVLERFRSSSFAVIAGPAGAGKDTLRNGLIFRHSEEYSPIISTTTRPPRLGEVNGVDYHFREIDEVEQAIKNKEYFQAALVHEQQVSCLHTDEIVKLREGQTGLSILIVDIEKMFYDWKPDLKTIFLTPPNYEELVNRVSSGRRLADEEVERRLEAAHQEIGHALKSKHFYCLVTESIPHVLDVAHEYLKSGKRDEDEELRAKAAMIQMLKHFD